MSNARNIFGNKRSESSTSSHTSGNFENQKGKLISSSSKPKKDEIVPNIVIENGLIKL